MKIRRILIAIIFFGAFSTSLKAQSIAQDVQQLVLDYQKLAQLKNILNDMYKGYTIISNGYNSIKNVSQGNFNLHQAFLDGLMAISPAVKNYVHVADIIEEQASIVKEYKAAYNTFRQDKNFNPEELIYIGDVYTNLVNQSVTDIDELTNILTANKLRMSDDERLHAIDHIYAGSTDKLSFLRQFNNNTRILAIQRARDGNDQQTLEQLYGIK